MHAPRSLFVRSTLIAVTAALAASVAAAAPAQASTVWDRVAACESGGNWAISTGNGYFGGLQFSHSTWLAYGGGAYATNASGASRSAQITVASRTLAAQGPGAWPVCGALAGLTRANGAAATTVSRSVTRRPIAGKLAVDGELGPLTRAAMNRKQIFFNTRPAIRAWQARLRVTVDGVAGPQTISALQRWLNSH